MTRPSSHTAITVYRPQDEVRRLWSEHRPQNIDGAVVFKDAPGDRGTEIHVDVQPSGLRALFGSGALPKVKDDLRHFKQRVETGEIPRSDATPEGERAERKLKQRPAQPLNEHELEEVGVR
jgi:hypothetical protein